MNERVTMLRQQSLETEAYISAERAELMTEFYRQAGNTSVPVRRALAFKYMLERKAICINPGELIVGERGPAPKATYTYPELCCHSLEDLDILDSRPKISFKVSQEVREVYKQQIIPYWQGNSMRDLIFQEMSEEWKAAYDAGIFTEFMEQRAPGHTVLDDKIYRLGFLDFIEKIEDQLANLDYLNDPEAYQKQEELKAMRICAEGIITFAKRYAQKAKEIAQGETDPLRKSELETIAEVCSYIPAHAPRNFWEALQAYWFVHLGVILELNTWDAFNPGRLDQHLYPFYKKALAEGTLTEEKAKELLQCFWVKFNNQPAPPKVGVTAAESGTYTDFANINSGGLKADGSDGVNDVTYLVLDVIDEMRLLQPSSNIQLSKKNPDRFIRRAARIIRKGWGQPSVFNADSVVEELLRQGKSIEDARQGGTSGCVETGAFGKESYILTGYFNLPKIFELTLHNGIDPKTGGRLGLETGDPGGFSSYEELFEAFKKQLHYFLDIKVKGSNVIERLYAAYMPSPFLSMLIDDCILKAKDYNDGGARYNTNYIQGVGLGSLTDTLSGIRYHVYDQKDLTMEQLLKALEQNFEGHEGVRQLLLNKTPHFGNDDDYADEIMVDIFNAYYNEVNGRPTMKGGVYRINMLPTTCHVYFGSVIGATADGRRAWEPLSEGISPVQGSDRLGPTAVIKSASKMDHARTGGTLLNLKFTPQVVEGDEGLEKLVQLVRSYFKLSGHHIQFNVVSAKTLRAAQKEPEKYRDLIVRVAGYSDYFCDLSEALQEEIITRTEHTAF
ncbi:pyruvate formate-lyase [Desulfosporosinus acidiphilus SJ4]|uniref:Pyruvate formate-lyase n=1 Tax=Desulfosporosinus acidiphilus (strain DSM 22704 / JCM 16185 / SJ4) TaxID=646529 RepID=I4D335_DESAJ|nr:trans-4-hydroxy-L-proline dehydratase [Desulfosporosinus acidiphilus]AFM40209.1 pyruvate formate-lyase [Desulfosporosinus acidiphilus SJ4]